MSEALSDLNAMDYRVVQQCMHCGMCLPTCPTYALTKRERNSPRGRIALMRAIADEELPLNEAFAREMSFCLGCLACQTACPAGVNYAELFETSRAAIERTQKRPWRQRLYRGLTLRGLFRYPRLMRAFGRVTEWTQRSGLEEAYQNSVLFQLVPDRWRRLIAMTPKMSRRFSSALIQAVETPPNKRYRVGLLTGCVQDIAYSDINRDTVDVLLANGCEVVTPRHQSCCGSIHGHNGVDDLAVEMAKRNLDAFPLDDLDAIITNAGGCGSHLKHYAHWLGDDSVYGPKAQAWDAKVKDIHEWLVAIGLTKTPSPVTPRRVAYHESCHLTHGQKVVDAPRLLLGQIPGLTLVPLAESNWCCGSAGVYSITQPETSDWLLERKVAHVLAAKPDIVASANPGCDLQLQRGLREAGHAAIRVVAPVSLLAEAYR